MQLGNPLFLVLLRSSIPPWWNNLSEEDKKERIAKLHEGHQAWWVNLSEEDKKERIAKLLLL